MACYLLSKSVASGETLDKHKPRTPGCQPIYFVKVLALLALLWIASALGWISGGSSFAGADGSAFGASAGSGATAGNGGGGEGQLVSVGPSGLVNGGIGPDGFASTTNPGCFLGFICVNASAGADENQADATVDEEAADVNN